MGPIILAKISPCFCAPRFCSCVRARCDLCGRPWYVIVQLTDNIVWKRLTGRGQVPASVPFDMHAPRKLCSAAGPWAFWAIAEMEKQDEKSLRSDFDSRHTAISAYLLVAVRFRDPISRITGRLRCKPIAIWNHGVVSGHLAR